VAQYKQKWLHNVSRLEDIRYPERLLIYWKTKRWTAIKETTSWIKSWGRNGSFVGPNLWPEEEEENIIFISWSQNRSIVGLTSWPEKRNDIEGYYIPTSPTFNCWFSWRFHNQSSVCILCVPHCNSAHYRFVNFPV